MPSTDSVWNKLVNAAVLFCVCKNAIWSIVHNQYTVEPSGALALCWYGLTSLYALTSWAIAGESESQGRMRSGLRIRVVVALISSTATVACILLTWIHRDGRTDLSVVAWYDLAVVAVAFGYNAVRMVHFSEPPP